MTSDDRKRFLGALREIFGSQLRADGFRSSGANYRRFRDPVIQVINIQGSRYGGECCVNLGIHLSFLPTIVGRPADPKTLAEMECEFRWRLAPEGRHDQWWAYGWDEGSAKASATRLAELYRERGKPLLDQWLEFPGQFVSVTIADFERPLPARVHAHLGRPERARDFALFGLKHLGQASALRPELEHLIRTEGLQR